MVSGGHARSGPPPDPNSLKSAKRGLVFTALPAEGYQGDIPRYPLPATGPAAAREGELWAWAWRTPQACAWARQPWRWHSVAMWVRTARICEGEDATAADKNSLHRFADQVGLSPAGLKENGWQIARDEVAERRVDQPAPSSPSTRSRLSAVRSAGAAG